MMTDYNLSDHWSTEPAWVKSLVSSLYRHRESTAVLPLTVVVDEIANWAVFASGEEAWDRPANCRSLHLDLEQSAAAIGNGLRAEIVTSLNRFDTALTTLTGGPRSVRKHPPGQRANTEWTAVLDGATALLEQLESDRGVGASWDDLVAIAKDPTLASREYRTCAELLHDQLRRRGQDADKTFRALVAMVAYGVEPGDIPLPHGTDLTPEDRLTRARAHVCSPAETGSVVVWLGYQGRVTPRLNTGRVSFFDAHWVVPNVAPGGQHFAHKVELEKLVQRGSLFQVAKRIDEESAVDSLVRVDLGVTHAAGAWERASEIVNTIIDVALHHGGGIRPQLAQYGVLYDGNRERSSFMTSPRQTGFPQDNYGADMTAESIDEFGPQLADALARDKIPGFLGAALEAQTAARRPFSRDFVLRQPSDADIASVIPLADRAAQHVAAYAGLKPADLFDMLGERWSHARWLTDVRRAVDLCLVGGSLRTDEQQDRRDDLVRAWHNPTGPWILVAADRAEDLKSICMVECERAWIERMLDSTRDNPIYAALISEYQAEGEVLAARRARVRNALAHGNPAQFQVTASVRPYSQFLSGTALRLGLESYVTGHDPAATLAARTAEYTAMHGGADAATYWRAQHSALP